MDPSKVNIPVIKDMTIDNITENTILINSQGSDRRMKFLLERLVTHLHDFARETRLSTNEWMAALNFMVQVGQISTDVRHVRIPKGKLKRHDNRSLAIWQNWLTVACYFRSIFFSRTYSVYLF